MKKIKVYINTFNRYLIYFRNSIKNIVIKHLRSFRFPPEVKKMLFFFVRLEFMKNVKFKISVFSRYLILLIVLLFSYLFYLSIPAFYNYGDLQKEITKKLLAEFNLNAALSANITYKILPSPNFEISNVILSTDSDKEFNEFAQIKKMNIYVSIQKLHSQKELEIKKIIFSNANLSINKNSFNFINDFFKKKSSSKKIIIKKSKIFFKENVDKNNVVALSSIKKSKIFYDKKENRNVIIIDGSIFNTKFNLSFLRSIANQNLTNSIINFKQLNAKINNEFLKSSEKTVNSEGAASINFFGFKNIINYELNDEFILFASDKERKNDQKIYLNGKINISPFYYNIYVDLESIKVIKFFENFSKMQNLLQNKILLNKNFNGKITFDIHSLPGTKLFDKAQINLEILNGKLMFNDSSLISNKIGKVNFMESTIQDVEGKTTLKSKILFNIDNQKKFYQKLQILKSNRKKLNNIYLEIEKDLGIDEIKINKLIINKGLKNNNKDLTTLININNINNINNWIKLKKILNQIFSEIS